MPIYEYRCQSCDNELEVLVRSGNEPESCPACEGKLERKISRTGVIFKGSGFYVTDSRGSSSGGGEKKSTNGGSTPEASKDSGGSGESKSGTSETKASSSESSNSTSTKTESSPKKSTD